MEKKKLNDIKTVANHLEISEDDMSQVYGGTIMTHMVALTEYGDL